MEVYTGDLLAAAFVADDQTWFKCLTVDNPTQA